jgi:hypothetical protein
VTLIIGILVFLKFTGLVTNLGAEENNFPINEAIKEATDKYSLDGCGLVERIEIDRIVILDVLWPLTNFVNYYSIKNGEFLHPSQFEVGSFVGFRINTDREIIAMYLFD